MNTEVGTEVEARLVVYALLALVFLGGCAPKHVLWRDTDTIIQPQGSRVETRESPHGYLVVEMRQDYSPGGEEMPTYPRAYLYDQKGNFLNKFPNNTALPTGLPPGEYIVLIEAGPLGQFRRIQVRVEDGRTTTASLADIEQAPGL